MHYAFGDYVLDAQRYELHRAGVPVKLRRKVFQLLVYLLENRSRVVFKLELFDHLWPKQFVGDEALKSCIAALRHALGERGREARFVRTVHGQGYRFVAAVEEQTSDQTDDTPLAALATAVVPHTHALPAAGGEGALPQVPPLQATPLDAEHKQVTVVCGALADASALAVHLGPEAMYHLMHDLLAVVQDTVQRYEGSLMHVSGDGFVALFGAPVAHEDHARRAILAALDLRQRLRQAEAIRVAPDGVALRLGVHTGPVVVGPLAYAPEQPYISAGETLQHALQLQRQAAPDILLVSATTYALVQEEVQAEVCEPLASDASSPAAPVYAIGGRRQRRAGVPQRGVRPLSPCVGRTHELALLQGRLALALGGQGQVIGVAGEPGLGKSRLLHEFRGTLHNQSLTWAEGHCLPYGGAIPYRPVRQLLRQLWAVPDAAAAPTITATVQQQLRAVDVTSKEEELALLQLLNLAVDPEPWVGLTIEARRARTFALLRHIIRHASQQQPLVLTVENLHWIDPSSEVWLASLVEQLEGMSILLLTTYRSGYQPPWLGHSVATQMALPRLSPRESLSVLRAVPRAADLPVPVQQAILAKAAGNPFFVEELSWAAVAQGGTAQPLPDTIEAVLAARLDRLPATAKHLLQAAAVVGTTVPLPLLQRLAALPEGVLRQNLEHLQRLEFLRETALVPEHLYTFKHALTQEVAYNSLLQEGRRTLHAQIVEALETLSTDQMAEQVDRLTYHALRAELWAKAQIYAGQAGEKALARSACREAAAYFEQALSALAQLPETRHAHEQAIDLRLALSTALEPSGDWERILAVVREAEALSIALDDPQRLGRISVALSIYFRIMGNYEQAIAAAQRTLALATASGDTALGAQANLRLGYTYQAMGNLRQAIDYYRQTATFFDGARRYERVGQGFLPAVLSRAWLAMCHAELGLFTEGRDVASEGLGIAEAADHSGSVMVASHGLGRVAFVQGDLLKALPLLERAMDICRGADLPGPFPWIAMSLAGAYLMCGRIADAVSLLMQAKVQSTAPGRHYFERLCSLPLGRAHLLQGRLEDAQALADRALALGREQQALGHQAHTLRLLGDIAATHDPPDLPLAEGRYQQAMALAKELGMRPLQAHCHRGLGTLYTKIGRTDQARVVVATATDLYRTMGMTFWLSQAEEVLIQAV